MVKEWYVSLETAKLLKEVGFKDYCETSYYKDGSVVDDYPLDESYDYYDRPSLYVAHAWLMDIHDIYVDISIDDLDWSFQLFDISDESRYENGYDPVVLSSSYAGYKSYQDALENGIAFAIEHVIKPHQELPLIDGK